MRRGLLLFGFLILAACEQPTPGGEALAEMSAAMRAQTDLVERGENLRQVFGDCTDDCTGHQAGYLWALEQPDIRHEDDCPEPDNHSFNHGCQMGVRAASFL